MQIKTKAHGKRFNPSIVPNGYKLPRNEITIQGIVSNKEYYPNINITWFQPHVNNNMELLSFV